MLCKSASYHYYTATSSTNTLKDEMLCELQKIGRIYHLSLSLLLTLCVVWGVIRDNFSIIGKNKREDQREMEQMATANTPYLVIPIIDRLFYHIQYVL